MNRHEHVENEALYDELTLAQRDHVALCTECAQRHRTALAVKTAVAALPREAPASAAVLALLEAKAAESRWRWPRQRPWFALAAAATVLAAVYLVVVSQPRQRPPMNHELAQEIALDHLHYENNSNAAEITGSLGQIDDFFAQTIKRRPRLALLEAANVVGGKRCRIGGEWSALIWLERAGRWLSLFSMPQDAIASRGCMRAAGVNVCGVGDPHGGSRVLAGNLPEPEMLRLLDESME